MKSRINSAIAFFIGVIIGVLIYTLVNISL